MVGIKIVYNTLRSKIQKKQMDKPPFSSGADRIFFFGGEEGCINNNLI